MHSGDISYDILIVVDQCKIPHIITPKNYVSHATGISMWLIITWQDTVSLQTAFTQIQEPNRLRNKTDRSL